MSTAPPDWADEVAAELVDIIRFQRLPSRDHLRRDNPFLIDRSGAIELLAAKLRLTRCEGEGLGLQAAKEAIS